MNSRFRFCPPKQRLAQVSGRWTLPINVPPVGVTADAVLRRLAPAHAAPDIAVRIDSQTVCERRSKIFGEHPAVGKTPVRHVEDPDMRRPAVGDAAVDNVEPRLVR